MVSAAPPKLPEVKQAATVPGEPPAPVHKVHVPSSGHGTLDEAAHNKHMVKHDMKAVIHEMGGNQDSGLAAMSYIKLKRHLKHNGIDPHLIDKCAGKPSLLALAKQHGVDGA